MRRFQGMRFVLAACAAWMQTSASDSDSGMQACRSPSLLQVHGQTAQGETAKEEKVEICAVQGGTCFDLQLEKRWYSDTFGSQEISELPAEDVQLVVARYGEDLRWLDALPQMTAVVYNRGGPESLLPAARGNLQVIQQENTGREDEVFLRHIVEKYDTLPKVTVFLQGWPFGHCPGFLKAVRHTVLAMLEPEKVVQLQGPGDATQGLAPITGTFWQYKVDDGRLGLATSLAKRHFPKKQSNRAMKFARAKYNETCTKILGGASCPSVEWTAEGAQWAVTRDRIRTTPRDTYANAIGLGEGMEGKFRGLVLEALWPMLFGEPAWEPTSSKVDPLPWQSGAASSRARSNDGFCAADNGSRTLLFSCQERAEYCERERRRGASTGHRFELDRLAFKIRDATDLEPWQLEAKVTPILWGSATWFPQLSKKVQAWNVTYDPVIVERAGTLALRRSDTADKPVPWVITDFQKAFALSRLDESGHRKYLGCQSGLAALLDRPTRWEFAKLLNGWVMLRTPARQYLALDERSSQGRVHCHQEKDMKSDRSTFLLEALRK